LNILTNLAIAALAGCAAGEPEPPPTAPDRSTTVTPSAANGAEAVMRDDGAQQPVSDLPYARGKTFRTLDQYLAHLEQQGAIDLPWWREISPGVYEHVIHMPGARRETATREELMRRFGFTR